ncbi:MAG: VWA domain-containing protein [Caldilineaceae bacterium]
MQNRSWRHLPAAAAKRRVSPSAPSCWRVEETARDLGWPDRPVGWGEIQRKATEDANFKWNHPSTQHAAGLLATLAEFYAGADLTRGLTEEIATRQDVLDYVRAVEATVRFYGEGEEVIVQRLAEEGQSFLDVFVAQEQTVIQWNTQRRGDRLVAIYPAEGTPGTDHPLALLELGRTDRLPVTDNQRRTFKAFSEFLTSAESQRAFDAGYRPADLDIALDAEGSPFADTNAVDWRQPATTLQIPSASVVEVIQNVWWYTRRPTNVYLVVDTSGSMEGEKLARTKTALQSFISQIQGEREQVGIVEFGSGVKRFEPLRSVTQSGRARMSELVDSMDAYGNTGPDRRRMAGQRGSATCGRQRSHQRHRRHDRRPGERQQLRRQRSAFRLAQQQHAGGRLHHRLRPRRRGRADARDRPRRQRSVPSGG